MRDFEDSTLWRVSAFERERFNTGNAPFNNIGRATVLPTTLLADLARLEKRAELTDPLEVVAACVRQHESALIYLQYQDLVWPITLFPRERLVHSPRDLGPALAQGARGLSVLGVEPPGVRPPGHYMAERITESQFYRPLEPLLWAVAMHGPRSALLAEIGGTAAYRVASSFRMGEVAIEGALAPAIARLRTETASLKAITGWRGMDLERAARMLNGLYLLSGLMVFRIHSAARHEPAQQKGWLDWLRKSR